MIYSNAVLSNTLNIVKSDNSKNLFAGFIQDEIHPDCCLPPWDGSLRPCEEHRLLLLFLYHINTYLSTACCKYLTK